MAEGVSVCCQVDKAEQDKQSAVIRAQGEVRPDRMCWLLASVLMEVIKS